MVYRIVCIALLVAFSVDRTSAFGPAKLRPRLTTAAAPSRGASPVWQGPSSSPTALAGKLWDRMSIEEDPEPFWYLINCVAGLEIDLLRQCRAITEDMPDAVKFVVPTERKTRSHGPKKIVTETKVRYQGYVFGKLRLCPDVYEAVQNLDLCRSWMGTVNHKGHKKLPPAPIALNELEVENFGLEEEESVEDDDGSNNGGIIVDAADEDLKAKKKAKIDRDALKVYLGLAVEDMVKVTAKGKFLNEDGIVRRLKEGQIFVRFYTYGTMFEEWLDPADVRKLSNMEILQGLSGPTQPVTQRDLDDPTGSDSSDERGRNDRRPALGDGGARNRRQDRTARRFQPGGFADGNEQRRNDKNWNWYQDQQQQRPNDYRDDSHGYEAGSTNDRPREMPRRETNRDRGGDWAVGNVDSQWGRNPRQQQPQKRPARENQRDNRRDNRQADAAIRGDSDWSAFVTPANKRKDTSGGSGEDDDFFASLMNDLSSDLSGGADQGKSTRRPSPAPSSSSSTSDDDAFFSSLMSELSEEDKAPPKQIPAKKRTAPLPATQTSSKDDDFFAALEAELGTVDSDNRSATGAPLDDTDGLFAKLEAELTPAKKSSPPSTPTSTDDDFFAKVDAELAPALEEEKEEFFGSMSAPRRVVGAARAADPAPRTSTSSSASSPSTNTVALSQQTVPALKDMLRARGLKVSGKKADLIDRLTQ